MTGRQLQAMRGQLGLSLRQFGRLIHANYRTVHRWEREEYPIPHTQQLRCALAFHVVARQEPGREPCPQCHGAGLVINLEAFERRRP